MDGWMLIQRMTKIIIYTAAQKWLYILAFVLVQSQEIGSYEEFI